MRARVYKYSALDVSHVYMDDGATHASDAAHCDVVMGVYMLKGKSKLIATGASDLGRTWSYTGALDAPAIASDITVQVEGPTEWLCLCNSTGTRELQVLPVNGEAIVPAGWGALVAEGSVQAYGKTGLPDAYFKPRAGDAIFVGSGVLILVR